MTVKEYLAQARDLNQSIAIKQERLEHYRSLSERSAMSYRQRVKGNADMRYDVVADIVDLERNIESEIASLVGLHKEIQAAVNMVRNQRYRDILEARYLNNKAWKDISAQMFVDIRWVQRLHGRALKTIASYLDLKECTQKEKAAQ